MKTKIAPREPKGATAWNPDGLVLALQFWKGDRAKALSLARLLADIEPTRRSDVALYLCCDASAEQDDELITTLQHCEGKFSVGTFQSSGAVAGYPGGPNALWSATMEHFCQEWLAGRLRFESVFTFEADGAPLRRDWIAELIKAHQETLCHRLLITASIQHHHFQRHPNGNLIAHVTTIRNYPELSSTPPGQPWDMFHHVTLCRLARHDPVIRSEHQSRRWNAEPLTSMAKETAWLHGCQDNSAINFARRLVKK